MDCTVPEYITEHLEEIFQLMSSGKKKGITYTSQVPHSERKDNQKSCLIPN